MKIIIKAIKPKSIPKCNRRPKFVTHLVGITEFEVQALAYSKLKEAFPYVRGELNVRPEFGRGGRVDIAVFDAEGRLILIVEVKKKPDGKTNLQKLKYEKLCNAPCIYIRGMEEAERADKIALEFLKNAKPFLERVGSIFEHEPY